MERRSEPGFVGSANQRLVSTLCKNLGKMDLFSRWDAVSGSFRIRQVFGPNLGFCLSFWVFCLSDGETGFAGGAAARVRSQQEGLLPGSNPDCASGYGGAE